MPRGRQPEGDTVLSNAERQARHRARQKTSQPPAANKRPKADRRSRVQRWDDAGAAMLTVQAGCAAWFDALPESLRDSTTAMALQEIIDLDLEALSPSARHGDMAATDPSRHRRLRGLTGEPANLIVAHTRSSVAGRQPLAVTSNAVVTAVISVSRTTCVAADITRSARGSPAPSGSKTASQSRSMRPTSTWCSRYWIRSPPSRFRPEAGCARVSTEDQNLEGQCQRLSAAGCKKLFEEKISGATRNRPKLEKLIEHLRKDDILVVTRLNRLARSTSDLRPPTSSG